MAHTPGPWNIRDEHSGLYLLFGDGSGFPLPTVTSRDATGKQGRANAHLMAAAPDLLVALKGLLGEIESYEFDGNAATACEKARAAIAKAEAA